MPISPKIVFTHSGPETDIRDRLAMCHFRNLLMGLGGSVVSFSKVPL